MNHRTHILSLATICLLSTAAFGAEITPKIAWHGTWKAGVAEAKRTGKAIMLVSAAPHCHQVSGMW